MTGAIIQGMMLQLSCTTGCCVFTPVLAASLLAASAKQGLADASCQYHPAPADSAQ